MALPMTRPTKHPKTGVYQIRRRVPKPLQGIIGKAERVISLGTKDPEEAKRKAPAANRKIDEEFAAARAALGRFRDECLNDTLFSTLTDARSAITSWKEDYNRHRPHSALGTSSPPSSPSNPRWKNRPPKPRNET
jgi:transposase InsO family protein